jgi:serine/threonine-protein kinase
MDGARWERMQALFHDALGRPPAERRAFLNDACAGDGPLITDVLAMLDEDSRESSLLDRGVEQTASQVLDDSRALSFASREFGPYRLRELLGEGGMGAVYLAVRDDLGSTVAIKVLRDAWMSPARRDRFRSEQQTLARLNHSSIARLYDADTLPDGTPWFAMEYVEGLPLTEYCRRRAAPAEERLRLFRAVCEAADYAHRHAIIHRDLKPSNILVKSDGTVRLLDFGIAKQLDPADTQHDYTRTGLRMMTPAYAAPEQIRGEHAGIQTDVYALGVILYELLAGRAPFDSSGLSAGEFERMILDQGPEKPSAAVGKDAGLSRAAWADLDVLCLTAMHKDAERRYRSVEALIRDLDHYSNGEPLEARPDALGYRAGKFLRRNGNTVAAVTVVFLLLLGLVVFYTARLRSARNVALAEAARTERIQTFMLNLFNGGDKDTGPAEDLRVVTLVDRGVQEARSLNAEPAVQAELYETLGGIYEKLGKFDQADALLGAALEQRKSTPGTPAADIAESEVALGLLRSNEAKLEEAERLVRQGLEKSQRLRPPNRTALFKATLALGKVLEARGEYTPAIAILERTAKLEPQHGPPTPELAALLGELANNHFYAGHYDASDTLNRKVLAMDRQRYGERHPRVAQDLVNLGATQFERGHYPDAEKFYRQALDIAQSFYGKDHYETASCLTFVARTLIRESRYDEAAPLLEQALAIQERVNGPVHPRVASALNELGTLALKRDQLDQAEADFRRLVNIYQTLYHDRHYLIGIAVSNLASVYVAKKQYSKAEQLYREAIRRFTDTLSADHLNTGVARIKLGRTLLRERRYAEAEAESLAGYRIVSKQASPSIGWLENAREDLRAIYAALHEPDKAREFERIPAKPVSR